MLAFGCGTIVFGVWWAVIFRLFWPLAGSGVSSHCVWELTLSLCDDFEGFFVLDEERRLFTVWGSVCHSVDTGDGLVGHWRVTFLDTTLVMVSVISGGQLLVFWLEDETWLFLLFVFVDDCWSSMMRLLVHQNLSRRASHYMSSIYIWTMALMHSSICSNLLRRHLLKILIYQATIIIEWISWRLRCIWIRFNWWRLNHLVFIGRRNLIIWAISEWFRWIYTEIFLGVLLWMHMDWARPAVQGALGFGALVVEVVVRAGVLVGFQVVHVEVHVVVVRLRALGDLVHLIAGRADGQAFHLFPGLVDGEAAEDFVVGLRLCRLFLHMVILITAPFEYFTILTPYLLLMMPVLFGECDQLFLSHCLQARYIVLAESQHFTKLSL